MFVALSLPRASGDAALPAGAAPLPARRFLVRGAPSGPVGPPRPAIGAFRRAPQRDGSAAARWPDRCRSESRCSWTFGRGGVVGDRVDLLRTTGPLLFGIEAGQLRWQHGLRGRSFGSGLPAGGGSPHHHRLRPRCHAVHLERRGLAAGGRNWGIEYSGCAAGVVAGGVGQSRQPWAPGSPAGSVDPMAFLHRWCALVAFTVGGAVGTGGCGPAPRCA